MGPTLAAAADTCVAQAVNRRGRRTRSGSSKARTLFRMGSPSGDAAWFSVCVSAVPALHDHRRMSLDVVGFFGSATAAGRVTAVSRVASTAGTVASVM